MTSKKDWQSKLLVIVGVGVMLGYAAVPERVSTSPEMAIGWASAYAPGVMEATVAYRVKYDVWRVRPPIDWYTVGGYVAAMDCSRVGEVSELVDPAGKVHRVLIADCAGADGPADRFERLGIIVELDAVFWDRLTREHGRPLRVGLK